MTMTPFHVELTAGAVVGGATGASSYALQAAQAVPPSFPIGVLVSVTIAALSAIVAGAVAWGMLRAQHDGLQREVRELAIDVRDVLQRLPVLEERITQRNK